MAVISSIESNPARRIDDHGEFEAWASAATASGRGATHAIGQSVDFLINGIKERTEITNDEGRTPPLTFTIPAGKTSVTLGAQITGDPTTYKPKTIVMPVGAVLKLKPAAIKSFTRAEQDKSLVVILVLDGNENPVAGEPVYIMDKDDPRMVYQLDAPTDRHGFVRCEIPMAANQQKDILVLVRGIQEQVRLYPQEKSQEK